MAADPEECRMLAARCAEIAAAAATPQLKAWSSDLSMLREKLAIGNGAKFVRNNASRLDEGKRLYKSLRPKTRQSHPSRCSARPI